MFPIRHLGRGPANAGRRCTCRLRYRPGPRLTADTRAGGPQLTRTPFSQSQTWRLSSTCRGSHSHFLGQPTDQLLHGPGRPLSSQFISVTDDLPAGPPRSRQVRPAPAQRPEESTRPGRINSILETRNTFDFFVHEFAPRTTKSRVPNFSPFRCLLQLHPFPTHCT